MIKPDRRPANPNFSSGPCAKRPGWTLAGLSHAHLGRSHRAKVPRARLQEVIDRSRRVMELPEDYRLAIVPASDTGAVEMALWSLLGPAPIDVIAFESFGEAWAKDIVNHLKLPARALRAPYGSLPDLGQVRDEADVVFTWNGTTSGVRMPNADWLRPGRTGLAICDATSAAFAMRLPWTKLDVVTWSWQKALGGEAAHGMLALSPRAVTRLESYVPPWPLPKLFRMTEAGGRLNEVLFQAETINTPSMLCVEDAVDGLAWAESVGELSGLVARSEANAAILYDWIARTPDVDCLAQDPAIRSGTSVMFRITAPWFAALDERAQRLAIRRVAGLLEAEGAALDIAGHRDAPPALRIWTGATIEAQDVRELLPWLDWALAAVQIA